MARTCHVSRAATVRAGGGWAGEVCSPSGYLRVLDNLLYPAQVELGQIAETYR